MCEWGSEFCATTQRKKNFSNQIFFVRSLFCSERQHRRCCASFKMQLGTAVAVVVLQYESYHWRAFHMMLWVREVWTILSSFIPYFYESGIFRVWKKHADEHTHTHKPKDEKTERKNQCSRICGRVVGCTPTRMEKKKNQRRLGITSCSEWRTQVENVKKKSRKQQKKFDRKHDKNTNLRKMSRRKIIMKNERIRFLAFNSGALECTAH